MDSKTVAAGPGRTLLGVLAVAGLGAVGAVVALNPTPRAGAQPVEAGLESAVPTDILRKTVIIQFRRDALGLAGPAAPGWAEAREGTLGVQGDVIAVRPGWIGIRGTDPRGEPRDVWVPTHAIMSIISR